MRGLSCSRLNTRHLGSARRTSQALVRSSSSDASEPSTSLPAGKRVIETYTYHDSDGKGQKATIEHVFGALAPPQLDSSDQPSTSADGLWQLSWQMNERNIMWNSDLKLRLIKRIASEELGISDEEMDWRLQQLSNILPGLEKRLANAPAKLVARFAAHTAEISERILALKLIFPQADILAMVSTRLTLLLDDKLEDVEAASVRLKELLPGIKVDKFVELHPLVLDSDNFQMAVEDAKRIMPTMDIVDILRRNPDTILSLVKGKNLITYDAIGNPWS